MAYIPEDERTATERVSTIGIENDAVRGRVIGLMRIYEQHSQHVYGTSVAPARIADGPAATFSVSYRDRDGVDRRGVYLVKPGSNHPTNWDSVRRLEREHVEWLEHCAERDDEPTLDESYPPLANGGHDYDSAAS